MGLVFVERESAALRNSTFLHKSLNSYLGPSLMNKRPLRIPLNRNDPPRSQSKHWAIADAPLLSFRQGASGRRSVLALRVAAIVVIGNLPLHTRRASNRSLISHGSPVSRSRCLPLCSLSPSPFSAPQVLDTDPGSTYMFRPSNGRVRAPNELLFCSHVAPSFAIEAARRPARHWHCSMIFCS